MIQKTSLSRRLLPPSLLSPLALVCLLMGAAGGSAGADNNAVPAGPRVHALIGVRIVVAPGRVVERGVIVLRDGLIEAAGAEVVVPADARRWDLEGHTVYPGLIESLWERPWPEEALSPQGSRAADRVTPERDASFHAFDADLAKPLRQAGFTIAHVVPQDGVFRGQSAVLSLGDGGLERNLLRRNQVQYVALDPQKGESYGDSLMGAVALFRQTVLDARWYGAARAPFEAGSTARRVPFDRSLEALQSVVDGTQPVLFEAASLLDLLRIGRLSQELSLKAWAVGTGEEYKRLALVQELELPLLLPLAFPEPPKVGAEGEDDLTVGLEELRHWQRAPDNPLDLLDAGLTVAFTRHGLEKPLTLFARIDTLLKKGLKADEALAALTTTPAALLGLDHLVGTIEAGKLANLLVVEGELWTSDPKILEVWIDGERYEDDEKEPPALDPSGHCLKGQDCCRSASPEVLARQAVDLAQQLQDQLADLDRRSERINSQEADFESRIRNARLWLDERENELDSRDEAI